MILTAWKVKKDYRGDILHLYRFNYQLESKGKCRSNCPPHKNT